MRSKSSEAVTAGKLPDRDESIERVDKERMPAMSTM